jgi:hypothetical protein
MLKLDNTLLQELGLDSLPEDQKRSMLQHIYETLELRVGTNLANQMTDQQLDEFSKFIDEGGDANQNQALQWLETNLPNYKQVVNDVFEALKLEIKQMAPQLVAASQQQVPAATEPYPVAQPGTIPSATTDSYAAPQQPSDPYTAPSQSIQQQPTYGAAQQPPQPQQPYQPAPTPQPQQPPQQPPTGPSQQPPMYPPQQAA